MLKNKKFLAVGVLILLYAVAKVYVLSTPTPLDDQVPDMVKDKVMDYIDSSD